MIATTKKKLNTSENDLTFYIDIIAICNHSCCHRHIVYKYYAIKDGHNTGKNHADFFQLFIDPLR